MYLDKDDMAKFESIFKREALEVVGSPWTEDLYLFYRDIKTGEIGLAKGREEIKEALDG